MAGLAEAARQRPRRRPAGRGKMAGMCVIRIVDVLNPDAADTVTRDTLDDAVACENSAHAATRPLGNRT